ncbi:hypothetical protein D3874_24285 [Oleomonas cavernae]|uniref:Uncharacterized protein n=1 Tax=Oleomonas cavernae TaxID=2320859 RepID=A0A418WI43_9PROT|nr:hypothetical protein [Oleomonas cavernae]RJF89701.1 hypothetical protein D3874_24285 [Oleomonas cavernae]
MNFWEILSRQKADRETYRAITPQARSMEQMRSQQETAAEAAHREIDFLRRQHAEDQATIEQLRQELEELTEARRAH